MISTYDFRLRRTATILSVAIVTLSAIAAITGVLISFYYEPAAGGAYQSLKWINTEIATGDLTDEIMKLKSRDGKDMVVYGGASFDSSLIKLGLIDEFLLFINPVAIGNGMTIFKDLNKIQKFNMVKSIAFDSGVVLLHYEARKA